MVYRTTARFSSILGRLSRLATVFAAMLIACLHVANAAEYKVQPGDVLEISVVGIADLKQRVMVPDEGEVFYPLIGKVSVSGLTITEIRARLKSALEERFYQQRTADGREIALPIAPDNILIDVAEYGPIYLNGDVSKPGSYPFRPGLTVRQAVALAGGYDTFRTRMENPYLFTVDLRSQREVLLSQYASEQARIARVQTELGQDTKPLIGAEASPVVADIQRLEFEQLDTRKADFEKQKKYLTEAVRSLGSSLELLEKQMQTEAERTKIDQEDLIRVEGLVAKGMAPVTRLSDTRRLVLLSASRATEIEARTEQVRLRRAEEERKLQRLFDERRLDLLKELQDTKLALATTASKLAAVTEKMFLSSAIRSQVGRGGAGTPDLVIFRKGATGAERITATEDSELLPRDVVDVALTIDMSSSIDAHQKSEVREKTGALPTRVQAQ